MNKYKVLLISFIIICSSPRGSSDLEWDPRIDECKYEFVGYECKPTIDAKRKPNQVMIDEDADAIIKTNHRNTVGDIFTHRTYEERVAISESYYNKKNQKKTLYNNYRKWKILGIKERHYNKILWTLLQPPSEFYVKYLKRAAYKSTSDLMLLHNTQIIISLLGGLSNKGLKYLNRRIKDDYGESLDSMLRKRRRNHEGFITLVELLLKGNRNEEIEIDEDSFEKDLIDLKTKIRGTPDYSLEEKDKSVEYVSKILTERGFVHLRKLFTQFEEDVKSTFQKMFEVYSLNEQHKRAIHFLHSVIMDQPAQFVQVLRRNFYFSFLSSFIISRSEMDLENIKIAYRKSTGNKMHEHFYDVFNIWMDGDGERIIRELLYEPKSDGESNQKQETFDVLQFNTYFNVP